MSERTLTTTGLARTATSRWRPSSTTIWGVATFLVLLSVPTVVTSSAWQSTLLSVVIASFAAQGLTLLFGLAGQISLAQASFVGIGAYAPALLTVRLGLNPWLGLPVGVLVAFLIALLVGIPVLRLEGINLAIATAALNVIFVVAVKQLASLTGGPFGLAGLEPLHLFGVRIGSPSGVYYLGVLLAGVVYWLTRGLVRSPIGLMFSAIAHDSRAAALAGIRVPGLKARVFAVSAAYAAVGGFLLAEHLLVVVPESFGLLPALLFLVMVVIGGASSIHGAYVGAAFVTILPVLIPQYPRIQQLVFAVAFVLTVMFLPTGLMGLPARLISRLPSRGRDDLSAEDD